MVNDKIVHYRGLHFGWSGRHKYRYECSTGGYKFLGQPQESVHFDTPGDFAVMSSAMMHRATLVQASRGHAFLVALILIMATGHGATNLRRFLMPRTYAPKANSPQSIFRRQSCFRPAPAIYYKSFVSILDRRCVRSVERWISFISGFTGIYPISGHHGHACSAVSIQARRMPQHMYSHQIMTTYFFPCMCDTVCVQGSLPFPTTRSQAATTA